MGYVWSQQWPQEEEAVTRITCRYCAHSEGRLWSSGGENRKTGTFISRSAVRGTLESNNTIWTICREPRKNQDSNQDSHSPRAPRPGSSMPRTQAESNMILTEIQRITYHLRSNSFLSPHCCSGGSVPCQCERLDAESSTRLDRKVSEMQQPLLPQCDILNNLIFHKICSNCIILNFLY